MKSKFKEIKQEPLDQSFEKKQANGSESEKTPQKSVEDAAARKAATEHHKKLIEAKKEYEKKKQQRLEQQAKEEMDKCTFKPSINEKSKNLESRFKNGGAPTPEEPKDAKAAAFMSGGGITAADLLGGGGGAAQAKPGTSPKKRKSEELPQVGQYLQCTFKPEIIGTNFNKQILNKKKGARGVDDAAKRMREAHEEREKTKNYLER